MAGSDGPSPRLIGQPRLEDFGGIHCCYFLVFLGMVDPWVNHITRSIRSIR